MTTDLLAVLEKSLDRVMNLYIFIWKVQLSWVRASVTIAHISKFYKNHKTIVRIRFFFGIANRPILFKVW